MSKVFGSDLFIESSKILGWHHRQQLCASILYVFIWKDWDSLRRSLLKRQARRKWTDAPLEAMYATELRSLVVQLAALGTSEVNQGASFLVWHTGVPFKAPDPMVQANPSLIELGSVA
jgi:hypothetical protein